MMQFQSDIIGIPVLRPSVMETTALGAAFAAGLAMGIWKSTDELKQLWAEAERFEPKCSVDERNRLFHYWKKAIQRSKGWVEEEKERSITLPTVVEDVVEEVVKEVKSGWEYFATEGILVGMVCLGIGTLVGFGIGRQRYR